MSAPSLWRTLASGLSDTDDIIGCIVYETAQGTVDLADDGTVEPLGIIANLQDGKALIAGPGEEAFCRLSEDFEYSDSKIFGATTDGEAAVFTPAAGTVTTATMTWTAGYIKLPGAVKGASGSMQPCIVMPQLQIVKAS